jgi:hypothetical protein
LDNANLVIQLLLGDRTQEIAHAVAFHEQRPLERPARHRLEIVGAVEPGGAVVVGRADLLQILEEVARQVLRAIEHQMLEQMGEAGLAAGLVLGADIVPGADRDHRRLTVLVDDNRQAVLELEHLIGNGHLADQRADRRGLRRGGARNGRGRFGNRAGRGGGAGGERRGTGKENGKAVQLGHKESELQQAVRSCLLSPCAHGAT